MGESRGQVSPAVPCRNDNREEGMSWPRFREAVTKRSFGFNESHKLCVFNGFFCAV